MNSEDAALSGPEGLPGAPQPVKRDRPEGLQKGNKDKKSPGTLHVANKDTSALAGKGSRADDEDVAKPPRKKPMKTPQCSCSMDTCSKRQRGTRMTQLIRGGRQSSDVRPLQRLHSHLYVVLETSTFMGS